MPPSRKIEKDRQSALCFIVNDFYLLQSTLKIEASKVKGMS